MPRVTVIVPIYNGGAFLPAFFESLLPALPPQSEVILVDDCSIEPVWGLVPEMPGHSVIRIQNERNLGYSGAVNRAFEVATGDILVQLNTDLVLDPACVTAMVDLIDRERDVGIVASRLLYPSTGLLQHIGMAFGHYTKPHIYREIPAGHPLANRTREVQIATGATVAMTRQVLDRIGPLDERYYNCNEDIEHCLLALQHGYRNFVCAESVAYHWESQSGPARFAQAMTSEMMFWSRWGDDVRVDLDRFVDEAIGYVVETTPALADVPFEVIDLSRGPDNGLVLDCLERAWPGCGERVHHHRQVHNFLDRLWLSMQLPHWFVSQPVPFIYIVDRYRQLDENQLWFQQRRQLVQEEIVVDLSGVVLPVSEAFA